jgi:hypothetical protein
MFVSTDGGDTWLRLPAMIGPITTTSPAGGGTFVSNGTYTGNAFQGRSISSIVIDPTNPNVIYVSSTRGRTGVEPDSGGSTSNPPPPRPPFGLFKSTDGGNTFSFIWDGGNTCPGSCLGGDLSASVRGVHETELDPANHNTVYAGAFPGQNNTSGGVYRSLDGGTTWTRIYTPINGIDNVDRASFDVARFAGHTLMYVGDGNDGANVAQVFRSFAVESGVPAFTNMTAAEVPAGQSAGYCSAQCWYDNVVKIEPGFPQVVAIGGSYDYGTCGGNSDCRAVLLSGNFAGSWFDMTWDSQDNGMPTGPFGQCCNPNQFPVVGPAPNQMHPDHHAILFIPGTDAALWDGSDGGIVRTDGNYTSQAFQCTGVRAADGSVSNIPLCQQLLGVVPNLLINMNFGLTTLQFQSISAAPNNGFHLAGGTQDNGTLDNSSGPFTWNQIIFGDGGPTGFNPANSGIRFNSFTGEAKAGNFRNGDPNYWALISLPMLVSGEGSYFYSPMIADPSFFAAGTEFQGSEHVWRTQDNGGPQGALEANCQVFLPFIFPPCGDFVPLGDVVPGHNNPGALPGAFYGGDRLGGAVSAIARTRSNTNVAWATTGAGRVFISTNVNAVPGSAVVWNRLDPNLAGSADPTRFPTGIAIDPLNTNHAWVTYSGYAFNTPGKSGHIFSVTWDGVPGDRAVFTNISNALPDIPLSSIALDPATRDIYVGSDFAVFRLPGGTTFWDVAGLGMPIVESTDVIIQPGFGVVEVGTHGLSTFIMSLY